MKSFSRIFERMTAFQAVFLFFATAVSVVYSVPVYAEEYSAVQDPGYEFPEQFDEDISSYGGSSLRTVVTDYTVRSMSDSNPEIYLPYGGECQVSLVYSLGPVRVPRNNVLYFNGVLLNQSLPAGVSYRIDELYVDYGGTRYDASYFYPGAHSSVYYRYFGFYFLPEYIGSSMTCYLHFKVTLYNYQSESYTVSNRSSTKTTGSIAGSSRSAFDSSGLSSSYKQTVDIKYTPGRWTYNDVLNQFSPSTLSSDWKISGTISNPLYGLGVVKVSTNYDLAFSNVMSNTTGSSSVTRGTVLVPPTQFALEIRRMEIVSVAVDDPLTVLQDIKNLNTTGNQQQLDQTQSIKDQTQTIKDQTTTITNQTNEIMNGFDSSSIDDSSGKISDSLNSYTESENLIMTPALEYFGTFNFDSYLDFTGGISSALNFVGTFVSSFFSASDDYFLSVVVLFCLSFMSIIVGLWRFRGG